MWFFPVVSPLRYVLMSLTSHNKYFCFFTTTVSDTPGMFYFRFFKLNLKVEWEYVDYLRIGKIKNRYVDSDFFI